MQKAPLALTQPLNKKFDIKNTLYIVSHNLCWGDKKTINKLCEWECVKSKNTQEDDLIFSFLGDYLVGEFAHGAIVLDGPQQVALPGYLKKMF